MAQDLVRFGVAIEPKLLEQVDALAEARGCTRSELLRDLARAEIVRNGIGKGFELVDRGRELFGALDNPGFQFGVEFSELFLRPFSFGNVPGDFRESEQAAVAVIDTKTRQLVARWPAQEHPNEMILTKSGKFLFVANANRNTVSLFDTETSQLVETLSAAMQPDALPGGQP